MKAVMIIALTLMVGTSAHAGLFSNEECVRVYRDQALELKENADYFNDQRIDKAAFVAKVSAISTSVAAQRLGCMFIEAPEVKTCVESAKNLYNSIRDVINLRAVVAGNQTKIEYKKTFVISQKAHNLKCRKYN